MELAQVDPDLRKEIYDREWNKGNTDGYNKAITEISSVLKSKAPEALKQLPQKKMSSVERKQALIKKKEAELAALRAKKPKA